MNVKDESGSGKTSRTRKTNNPATSSKQALKIWHGAITDKILQLTPDTQMAFDILISYHSVLESPIKKLEAIKKGLLSSAIKDLGDLFGSNQAYMADLLSITQPTLRKYIKERKQLDTNKSEHIIELFELFEKGVDTFGSLEEFKKWIDSPNVIFNERPVKLLDTITGINMVKNALLRLDYGVLA